VALCALLLSRDSVLRPSARLASEQLQARGRSPLPERLTPHSLRRTFCSVLYAVGEDPGVVMDEMGHTDPALALRVYRQSMRRGQHEKDALRELVEGSARLGVCDDDAQQVHEGIAANV
jgi:integrase